MTRKIVDLLQGQQRGHGEETGRAIRSKSQSLWAHNDYYSCTFVQPNTSVEPTANV